MSISTANLDQGTDSPKQARAEILAAVNQINQLTQYIDATLAQILTIRNSLSVTGDTTLTGNLSIGNALTFSGTPGNVGQVLASQGAGQPAAWVNLPAASGAANAFIYGTTNRYQGSTATGLGSTLVSSSTVKTGVSWTRNTTSLVITDPGHGRSVGERAIVRNTNINYFDSLITAADANTYTVTTTDTGATSGAAGAYSMGFTFAFVGASGSITGCQVIAPANWDCVLLGLRIHMAASTRGATTHNVTVPKGNINGVGPQTSMDALSIPNQTVRQDGNTLSAVGATIAVNLSGDFGVYQFAALPAATTGIHIVMNF